MNLFVCILCMYVYSLYILYVCMYTACMYFMYVCMIYFVYILCRCVWYIISHHAEGPGREILQLGVEGVAD